MNRQQVFDTVVAHLRKQGVKSVANGNCAYRGLDGKKCAIGCLIPDELYDPLIESMRCPASMFTNSSLPASRQAQQQLIIDMLAKAIDVRTDEELHFLRELQVVHDAIWPDGDGSADFESGLRDFAARFDVKLEKV